MKIQQGVFSENVRSISVYSSAWDLIVEEGFLPDNITGGFSDFLQHFDDFEAVVYFCVNHSIIICADDINADVIATFRNVTEFGDKLYSRYLEEEGGN